MLYALSHQVKRYFQFLPSVLASLAAMGMGAKFAQSGADKALFGVACAAHADYSGALDDMLEVERSYGLPDLSWV